MDIAVSHPAFQTRKLTVRTAGLLSGPQLFVNGEAGARKGNRYVVEDDAGTEVAIKLKPKLADPIPALLIGDEAVQLARPLTWYEYAWIGLPILLMFVGGGAGAFIGFCAMFGSSRILRSQRSTAQKFLLTGLVTVASGAAFFLVVVSVRSWLR